MGNIAILTDEQGNFIAEKDRYQLVPGEILAVAFLLLTNSKGELLIAQRSLNKKHDPGLWGPSAAGTLEPGESFETNIIKEAEEEIGLSGISPVEVHRELYWRPDGFGRYVVWYRAAIDRAVDEFILQVEEVAAVRLVLPDEILKEVLAYPEKFTGNLDRWKLVAELTSKIH